MVFSVKSIRAVGVALLVGIVAACSPIVAPLGSLTLSPTPVTASQASSPSVGASQTSAPSPTGTASPSPQVTPVVHSLRGALVGAACVLPTIVAPTEAPTPSALSDYDPTAGLHVTGRPPTINLATYRLAVTGKVDHPLSLTYDELRCLPKVGVTCELVCPGVFVDNATWAGAPLDSVLSLAGIEPGAQTLVLVAADGYSTEIDLSLARSSHGFLAYELNGGILPILHGFPIRAVFPGLEGSLWAKWLVRLEVD